MSSKTIEDKTKINTALFDSEAMPANNEATAPNIVTDTSEHFTGNDSEAIFPPRPKFLMLPLDKIAPSPLNPRKHFDPEALEELAASIRTHGVQQPIVVRQHVRDEGTRGGQVSYSIVMGERRWRAASLAGLGTVPALVRTDLDDLAHAELAMEENLRRRDLSIMEEANGYKTLMGLGKKQAEIGEAVGVSQSRIANIIRLLDLPEDVQALIENGKLKTGHGIALARYKDFPELCSAAATIALSNDWSVRSLEGGVLNNMTSAGGDILLRLSGYTKPKFDWETVCKACPFGAYRVEDSRSYCLRPEHYHELSSEATADADAIADAEAERLRAVAATRRADAKTHLAAATTQAEKKAADTELQQATAAANAVKDGLPKTQYGKIQRIGVSDPHACRFGHCPCHIRAVDNYSDHIVDACADPTRQSKVKAAETKTLNVGRKERFAETRRQIDVAPLPAMLNSFTERLAAVACWHSLRNTKKEAKMQIIERLAHDGPEIAALRELLTRQGHDVPDAEAWPVLEAVGLAAMAGITGEVLMRDELLQRYEYGDSDTAKATRTAWVLGNTPQATPSAAPQATHQVETETRLFPCADCKVEDMGAFYVNDGGEETFKSNTEGAWVCDLCQDKRKAGLDETGLDVTRTAPDPLLNCAECGETLGELDWLDNKGEFGLQRMCLPCITGGISGRGNTAECVRCDDELLIDLADGWTRTPQGDLRQGEGALITRKGAIYCLGCAPFVEICRECGCTQEFGCQDLTGGEGCDWAEHNADHPELGLCTVCVAKDPLAPNSGEDPLTPNEISDNGGDADDTEPDVNNEAPLCGCGEPTCLGICGNHSPGDAPDDNLDDWAYPAPEGMDAAKIIDADKMDAEFCRTCSTRPVVAGERDCAYCIALFFRAGTGKEASIGDICNL